MSIKNKYNDMKIVWYPDKLKSFVDGRIAPPIYVRIKPTNRCCHGCTWCVYNKENSNMHVGMSRADELQLTEVLAVIDDLSEMGVKAVTYSGGGEPLIHPGISEIFKATLDRGLALSLITNGQHLSGEPAELLKKSRWVRVSMDYWNAESMTNTRKVGPKQFQAICSNIASFSSNKNADCNLTTNWIITKENHAHIIEATKLMRDIGIELIRFSPVWTIDFHAYHAGIKDEVKKTLEKAKDLETQDFKTIDGYNTDISVTRSNPRCYYNQIVPVIGADGNIYTCHNKAYDSDGVIGSIKGSSFKEAWFSDRAKAFFDSFNAVETCKNQCANEHKNQLIQGMIDCYGDVFP